MPSAHDTLVIVPHEDWRYRISRLLTECDVVYPGTNLTGRRYARVIVMGDLYMAGNGPDVSIYNAMVRQWLNEQASTRLPPNGMMEFLK